MNPDVINDKSSELTLMHHASQHPYELYVTIEKKNFNKDTFMDEFHRWIVDVLAKDIDSSDYTPIVKKAFRFGFNNIDKKLYNTRAKSNLEELKKYPEYKDGADLDYQFKTNTYQWTDITVSLFRMTYAFFDNYVIIGFAFNPGLKFENVTHIIYRFIKDYVKKYKISGRFHAKLNALDAPIYNDERFRQLLNTTGYGRYYYLTNEDKTQINEKYRDVLSGFCIVLAKQYNADYRKAAKGVLNDDDKKRFESLFDDSLINDIRQLTNKINAGMFPIVGCCFVANFENGIMIKKLNMKLFVVTESTENIYKLEIPSIINGAEAMGTLLDLIFAIKDKELLESYVEQQIELLNRVEFLTNPNFDANDIDIDFKNLIQSLDTEELEEFETNLYAEIAQLDRNITEHENSTTKGENCYYDLNRIGQD